MKTIITTLLLALALALATGCNDQPVSSPDLQEQRNDTQLTARIWLMINDSLIYEEHKCNEVYYDASTVSLNEDSFTIIAVFQIEEIIAFDIVR